MAEHLPTIRSRGAELVVVGNGTAAQADHFAQEQKLAFPVYTDPGLRAYQAAGLRREKLALLSPRSLANGLRAFRAGARQSSTMVEGDAFQLGGAFVITPDGRTLFAQASTTYGDHADPADILRALEKRGSTQH